MCESANLGGGSYPCIVDPAKVNFAGGQALDVEAVAFRYNRDGADWKKLTDVLAPSCMCPGELRRCTAAEYESKCKSQYGAGARYTYSISRNDVNGNLCWDGDVGLCAVPNKKIEYLYDHWSLKQWQAIYPGTPGAKVKAPAPHNLIPAQPAFLVGIAS